MPVVGGVYTSGAGGDFESGITRVVARREGCGHRIRDTGREVYRISEGEGRQVFEKLLSAEERTETCRVRSLIWPSILMELMGPR